MDVLKETCAKREEVEIVTPYLSEGNTQIRISHTSGVRDRGRRCD